MTQDEINLLFAITITIHEDDWFGQRKNARDREETQEWVAQKLAEREIYTIPIASSWGMLTTKEKYIKHHKL